MCKLTILLYTQCNCGPRDGSYEEGFIVTKDWYNRLFLNLDSGAVPFERCKQATFFTLSPNRSNTMEFPRCHNVQIKNIRLEGQLCFRCFTRREIFKRTEKIKTLHAERKLLRRRFDALEKAEVKDAEFTRTMRHTMKKSPQFDKRTEEQKFHGTKAELSPVKFGSVNGMAADWETDLLKQLACQKLAKEKCAEKKTGEVPDEEKEQEERKKRDRLASFQRRLAVVNQRAASPLAEEDERPPPYEETEKDPFPQEKPLQRFRIARSVRRVPSGTGPTLDLMVPVNVVHDMHEESSADNASAPTESSTTVAITTQVLDKPCPTHAVVKYRTVSDGRAIDSGSRVTEERTGAASSTIVEAASNRGFTAAAAEAPEFRPFQRPPPTEPRIMRAPTAPRAMREGSLHQPTWQPRQQFATSRRFSPYRGWRG